MSKVKIAPGPFVLPMPLVLVGAVVEDKPNFMPAAFAGIVNYKPPIVVVGLNPEHHTCVGMAEHGTFSLNLPRAELVEATDWCGLKSGTNVDKSGVFETFAGELEGAPLIADCPLNIECRVTKTLPFDVDTAYFAEVVAVHADEDIVEDGGLRWDRVAPLLFTFPDRAYWKLGERVAQAWKVGKDFTP